MTVGEAAGVSAFATHAHRLMEFQATRGDECVVPLTSCIVSSVTDEPQVWYQDGFYPSEPVFVPSPDAADEDDGVILSVVLTPSQVRLLRQEPSDLQQTAEP